MSVRTAERRRRTRAASAFPVKLFDRDASFLMAGRATDISESGIFVVGYCRYMPDLSMPVTAEITLPADGVVLAKWAPMRTVKYRCRIVHTRSLGHIKGLGLEFVEKLG